jgi:hypothetical protein
VVVAVAEGFDDVRRQQDEIRFGGKKFKIEMDHLDLAGRNSK